MDPLSITASIAAILKLTTEVAGYLVAVKDAPKEHEQCAREAFNLSSLLITLQSRLNGCHSDEKWLSTVKSLDVQNGLLDQYKCALERLKSKLESGTGPKKLLNALIWKFVREEVTGILARMERLKTLIQIALEVDHHKLSQAIKSALDGLQDNSNAIKDDTSFIRKSIPGLEKGVDSLQESQGRAERDAILQWISLTNYPAQQSDFLATRQEGTAQWFLDSPEFEEWLSGSNKTLFCHGIPGAGKTIMAASVIDFIMRTELNNKIGLAYIYCNYKPQADHDTNSFLAAILKQLVQALPFVPEAVSQLYRSHSSRGTKPSLEELFSTLQHTLRGYTTIYIVVDALDEIFSPDGTCRRLIERVFALQTDADVRLMVTSRPIPDIREQFAGTLSIEVRASDEDVTKFVKSQICNFAKCIQRDDELQCSVQDAIVSAVGGMFLLARLYVESLRDTTTKREVKDALKNLAKHPARFGEVKKAYDDAYDNAVKRIESQLPRKSALARKVLTWISYAQRQLTTKELCHAVAIELGDKELDEDSVPDADDLVSVCAGLVTIDEQSNIIRLVHYTTQEYFERIRDTWNPSAQREISETCFTYLSFEAFECGTFFNEKELEQIRRSHRLESTVKPMLEHPFLGYAAQYWGHHARSVQEEISKLACSFLHNPNLASSAAQALSIAQSQSKYGYFDLDDCSQVTALHMTARFGLLYHSKMLLPCSTGIVAISPEARNGKGRTPLSWAAEQGHEAIVKLLVEREDVDADSKDDQGITPLLYAALRGHEAIVKLLIEREDVDADSKDDQGMTPLLYAALRGHEAIVKLLIEREDVDADSKDDEGRTPLLYAAWQGYEAIVKLLVEREDVDADSKGIEDRTPLSYVAEEGQEAIVKLLVEREDVDADSKDDEGRTPLLYAAWQGYEAIVKLLVEREDVDTDSKDDYGRTPLLYAAWQGHEAIVKLLAEREDVDADLKDDYGSTPLSSAAKQGHEAIVKLLVEREDVDADSKDDEGRTPLSYTASQGHEAIVKLLVERKDVNADSRNDEGRTPLSWAAKNGHDTVVELLLIHGAALNSKDEDGRTPLSHAARGLHSHLGEGRWGFRASPGHERVVKLLLERKDIEADLKDVNGHTPLWWAKKCEDEAIVKLLKEYGCTDVAEIG